MGDFDPDAYLADKSGGTAVADPPSAFDPDVYLKTRAPQSKTPQDYGAPEPFTTADENAASAQIARDHPALENAAGAVKDVVRAQVPTSLSEALGFLKQQNPSVEALSQGVDLLTGQKTAADVLRDQAGLAGEIAEADKTPAFSRERFRAGLSTALLLGGAALTGVHGAVEIKPTLTETLFPKAGAPSIPEVPLVEAQPVEVPRTPAQAAATENAMASTIIAPAEEAAPAAEIAGSSPLDPNALAKAKAAYHQAVAEAITPEAGGEPMPGGQATLTNAADNPEFANAMRDMLDAPVPRTKGRYWTVIDSDGSREGRFTDFAEAHTYMTDDAMQGQKLVEHAPGEKDVTLPYRISGDTTASRGQWTQSALRHLVDTGEITEAQAKEAGLQSEVANDQSARDAGAPRNTAGTPSQGSGAVAAIGSDVGPAALADIPAGTVDAVKTVVHDKAQSDFVSGLASQAREMFGPGAADAGEFSHLAEQNAREYAAIGASHLLEGKADKVSWTAAMREEYGARDATPRELNNIWRDSHDLLQEFSDAQTGRALRPKAQIKQATGIRQELGTIKQRLGDAITKAQGLSEYLRGLEKGSEMGAKSKQRQLALADKWMAADQEQVRRTLTDFVNKTLPPSERGRYVGAITRALRRPDLIKGDPGAMYRNAFRVMQAIENRTEEVHRGNVIADLKKISGRILDSPTVDLAAKRILQRTLKEINLRNPQKATVETLGKTREFLNRMAAAGKDVFMPQRVMESLEQLAQTPIKELPTTTLDDLHTKIRLTEKIGRLRFKSRESAWGAEKTMRLDEIKAGDGTPLELREMFRAQPGERLLFSERVQNWIARRFNSATVFDMGHLPMDVQFDLLQNGKGTYTGPLFDHIRNPIDAAYDRAQRRAINELDPLRSIIKKNKLGDTDETRIGLWAQLQQEGGEARAIESGVTPETIAKLKASGLTPDQAEAYRYMRERLDATLPEVQTLMHDLFNIDVDSVENYFPWMREWETYKPSADRPVFDARTGEEVSPEMLESFGQIAGDFTLPDTTKLQRGFTIERLPGAKTPIRMDAFDVFQRHMYSASRLLEMQRDLKLVGEIIRDDAFAEKFGTYGQKMLNDWVTATATDGRGGNVHRMPLLDMARKGSNRALVFFRLTSNIKHLSAVPQAMVNAGGPESYFRGLHNVVSKEGKAFLSNFPQVTERQAGDMSLQELQSSLGNDKSGLFPKGLALADRWGFVLGKEIDAINSRAVFIGRYLRNLEKGGIKTGLSGPIDQAAAGNALAFMRRTVSSTLTKDVQPVLGRGQGFGGNISIARAMNAFRQYALERWSLLRYDTPQAFKSGNYTRGVALLSAAVAAGLYETNISSAVRRAGSALLGTEDHAKEHETWLHRLMVDGFSMVPYMNNVVSAVQWGQSGIPLVDNFVNAGKTAGRVATAKTPESKKSAVISATGAATQLAGVPGSGVATTLAKEALVDKEKIKRQAAGAAGATRAGNKKPAAIGRF